MQIYLLDVYDPLLLGSRFPYTFMEWNLPDSQIIHYDRVSPGTGYADAVFEHAGSTPLFDWSRIAWNGFGWDLNRSNGVTYLTPEAYNSTRPVQSSLVAIFDQKGNQVRLSRDANGDLKEIKSPNGLWIHLSYANGRISRLETSAGDHVDYEYDTYNRLRRATGSQGTEEYSFDRDNRIVTVADSRSGLIVQNTYDALGRVIELGFEGNTIHHIHYVTDEHGNVVGADVAAPQSDVTRVMFHDETYAIEKLAAPQFPEPGK
jgi:YD repeat-containing protein